MSYNLFNLFVIINEDYWYIIKKSSLTFIFDPSSFQISSGQSTNVLNVTSFKTHRVEEDAPDGLRWINWVNCVYVPWRGWPLPPSGVGITGIKYCSTFDIGFKTDIQCSPILRGGIGNSNFDPKTWVKPNSIRRNLRSWIVCGIYQMTLRTGFDFIWERNNK